MVAAPQSKYRMAKTFIINFNYLILCVNMPCIGMFLYLCL